MQIQYLNQPQPVRLFALPDDMDGESREAHKRADDFHVRVRRWLPIAASIGFIIEETADGRYDSVVTVACDLEHHDLPRHKLEVLTALRAAGTGNDSHGLVPSQADANTWDGTALYRFPAATRDEMAAAHK